MFVLNDFAVLFNRSTFAPARVPHVLFWRGDYLNGEFKGGEQVDEFVEGEFVDVGLE